MNNKLLKKSINEDIPDAPWVRNAEIYGDPRWSSAEDSEYTPRTETREKWKAIIKSEDGTIYEDEKIFEANLPEEEIEQSFWERSAEGDEIQSIEFVEEVDWEIDENLKWVRNVMDKRTPAPIIKSENTSKQLEEDSEEDISKSVFEDLDDEDPDIEVKDDFNEDSYINSKWADLDDDESRYEYIKSKSVLDSDGFYTDYTMYKDNSTGNFVFVFGDNDVYTPEDEDFDYVAETEKEANEWFDNYNGFDDDMDEAFDEVAELDKKKEALEVDSEDEFDEKEIIKESEDYDYNFEDLNDEDATFWAREREEAEQKAFDNFDPYDMDESLKEGYDDEAVKLQESKSSDKYAEAISVIEDTLNKYDIEIKKQTNIENGGTRYICEAEDDTWRKFDNEILPFEEHSIISYDWTKHDDYYDMRVYPHINDAEETAEFVIDENGNKITTKEQAKAWLQGQLEEYSNTYSFPADIKKVLNKLVEVFGNTYFWFREALNEDDEYSTEESAQNKLPKKDIIEYDDIEPNLFYIDPEEEESMFEQDRLNRLTSYGDRFDLGPMFDVDESIKETPYQIFAHKVHQMKNDDDYEALDKEINLSTTLDDYEKMQLQMLMYNMYKKGYKEDFDESLNENTQISWIKAEDLPIGKKIHYEGKEYEIVDVQDVDEMNPDQVFIILKDKNGKERKITQVRNRAFTSVHDDWDYGEWESFENILEAASDYIKNHPEDNYMELNFIYKELGEDYYDKLSNEEKKQLSKLLRRPIMESKRSKGSQDEEEILKSFGFYMEDDDPTSWKHEDSGVTVDTVLDLIDFHDGDRRTSTKTPYSSAGVLKKLLTKYFNKTLPRQREERRKELGKFIKDVYGDKLDESLIESVDEVKRILGNLKEGNRIKNVKGTDDIPAGFTFKSSNGNSGEVNYKGVDYAYAIVDGDLRVMTSAEAGSNWSETLYKESLKEEYIDIKRLQNLVDDELSNMRFKFDNDSYEIELLDKVADKVMFNNDLYDYPELVTDMVEKRYNYYAELKKDEFIQDNNSKKLTEDEDTGEISTFDWLKVRNIDSLGKRIYDITKTGYCVAYSYFYQYTEGITGQDRFSYLLLNSDGQGFAKRSDAVKLKNKLNEIGIKNYTKKGRNTGYGEVGAEEQKVWVTSVAEADKSDWYYYWRYIAVDQAALDSLSISPINESTNDEDSRDWKIKDIEFAMKDLAHSMSIKNVEGSGIKYKVTTHDDGIAEVEFDPEWDEYVYTVNGKGPFSHSSYEYIGSDIAKVLNSTNESLAEDPTDSWEEGREGWNEESIFTKMKKKYSKKELNEATLSDLDAEIRDSEGIDKLVYETERNVKALENEENFLINQAPREIKKGGAFDSQEEIDEALEETRKELSRERAKLRVLKGVK